MKRSMWLLALALPLAAAAQGKGSTQTPAPAAARPAAGVNWEGQLLRATGAGAPDLKASSPAQARLGAELAAKMDAFRNLLAQAKGIEIQSGRTVGDALQREETRGRVEGALRGYKVVAKRYFSDSGVEVDVEVPLAALAAALAPAADAPHLNAHGKAEHTGLVVDARGLGVEPALAPRLLDASGKPLYTAAALSPAARRSAAVAAYFDDPAEASAAEALVGKRPLVLRAARAEGSDLVLDAAEAQKLTGINNAFLAEGRVAIVTE